MGGAAGLLAVGLASASHLLSPPSTLSLVLPANVQAAGTRRLAASASKGPVGRHGSAVAGQSTMKRRQEMLRGINTGDAVLLLGGDLNVTVVQAQGLAGSAKSTHPFARVHVVEPFPVSDGESWRGGGSSGPACGCACIHAARLPPSNHPPFEPPSARCRRGGARQADERRLAERRPRVG